jgi:hypothetical protein
MLMRNDNEIGWRSEPNPSGLQKSPYHLKGGEIREHLS